VIVVEGFFDCPKGHQGRLRQCSGFAGEQPIAEAMGVVAGAFLERWSFMLDGDEAGRRASQVLCAWWPTGSLAPVPASRQPDQLSDEEIQATGPARYCKWMIGHSFPARVDSQPNQKAGQLNAPKG
jgi:hypothetical protein